MDVNNSLQGVRLLSGEQIDRAENRAPGTVAGSDLQRVSDQATLSSAASVAAHTASDADVRIDKIAQVRQALAAGTYEVPSSAVAEKMLSQMLGE